MLFEFIYMQHVYNNVSQSLAFWEGGECNSWQVQCAHPFLAEQGTMVVYILRPVASMSKGYRYAYPIIAYRLVF